MAILNPKLSELSRLEFKSLESQFLAEIQHGLNCSPFESRAILQVVEETFFAFITDCSQSGENGGLLPGRLSLIAIQADEPSGKPLSQCAKVTVALHLHRGAEDDQILVHKGASAFRLARIPDLCQQALAQGGLLTREDLARRIFFVDPRTISRDLALLRKTDPNTLLPLRSNKHDIGPVLTHRVRIVELALEGKTFSQIREIMRHSPEAIANYVGTFTRCAQLHQQGLATGQIAFLLRRGPRLVEQYVELVQSAQIDKNRRYHLDELLLADGRGWLGNDTEKKVSHLHNAKL